MEQRSGGTVANFMASPFGSQISNSWIHFDQWITERIRDGRRIWVLIVELLLAAASFVINLRLQDTSRSTVAVSSGLLLLVFVAFVIRYGSFRIFGVCDQSFRHAGIPDVIAIAESVAMGSIAFFIIYLALARRLDLFVPGAFFFGDAITLFLLLSIYHFGARIYLFSSDHSLQADLNARRAVIIGAGDAGASVLKELLETSRSGIVPVALVDDDPAKKGTRICGVPVAGGLASLASVIFTFHATEVLICIPSATQVQRHRILAVCRECGIPVRILPCVADLLNQRASTRDLRTISIEDALLRERFVPDPTLTRCLVGGKVVLVTGAGGSIGSELCRQLAAGGPRRLILVDKSENSLFYCHMGIEEAFPSIATTPVLADVTDKYRLREVMLRERPDIAFHAAAFKHVGMMELHPDQAIRNNVLGTRNVLLASLDAGVESFVNVSTDKAVNPRCFMGLSKKLTEIMVKDIAESYGVRYMNVRFGNVAGSNGSVIQIFSEQITRGKPLRVTDPHATRYFMSIAEAVNLILCAAVMGRGGETFIFNMGDPVNIYELARTLTLFAGVVPGEELPIHFTGLKEGEKVSEELWEDWEKPQGTKNPQIYRLEGCSPFSIDILAAAEKFQELLADRDQEGLIEYVNDLVPDFSSQRAGVSLSQGRPVTEVFARNSA